MTRLLMAASCWYSKSSWKLVSSEGANPLAMRDFSERYSSGSRNRRESKWPSVSDISMTSVGNNCCDGLSFVMVIFWVNWPGKPSFADNSPYSICNGLDDSGGILAGHVRISHAESTRFFAGGHHKTMRSEYK